MIFEIPVFVQYIQNIGPIQSWIIQVVNAISICIGDTKGAICFCCNSYGLCGVFVAWVFKLNKYLSVMFIPNIDEFPKFDLIRLLSTCFGNPENKTRVCILIDLPEKMAKVFQKNYSIPL